MMDRERLLVLAREGDPEAMDALRRLARRRNEAHSTLKEMLAAPPSAEAWQRLNSFLDDWPCREDVVEWLPHIELQLLSWPPRLRTIHLHELKRLRRTLARTYVLSNEDLESLYSISQTFIRLKFLSGLEISSLPIQRQRLKDIVRDAPRRLRALYLEDLGIDDWEPVASMIGRFTELECLSLKNNRLIEPPWSPRRLLPSSVTPSDEQRSLRRMARFRTLGTIELEGNPIGEHGVRALTDHFDAGHAAVQLDGQAIDPMVVRAYRLAPQLQALFLDSAVTWVRARAKAKDLTSVAALFVVRPHLSRSEQIQRVVWRGLRRHLITELHTSDAPPSLHIRLLGRLDAALTPMEKALEKPDTDARYRRRCAQVVSELALNIGASQPRRILTRALKDSDPVVRDIALHTLHTLGDKPRLGHFRRARARVIPCSQQWSSMMRLPNIDGHERRHCEGCDRAVVKITDLDALPPSLRTGCGFFDRGTFAKDGAITLRVRLASSTTELHPLKPGHASTLGYPGVSGVDIGDIRWVSHHARLVNMDGVHLHVRALDGLVMRKKNALAHAVLDTRIHDRILVGPLEVVTLGHTGVVDVVGIESNDTRVGWDDLPPYEEPNITGGLNWLDRYWIEDAPPMKPIASTATPARLTGPPDPIDDSTPPEPWPSLEHTQPPPGVSEPKGLLDRLRDFFSRSS